MKKTAFLSMLFALLQVPAFAGAVDCYESARHVVGQNRAIDLCKGAVDSAPTSCFATARALHLMENQAVQLCSSTASAQGPTQCYQTARQLHLGTNQSVQLCQYSSNGYAASCYEAARAVLTENLAIDLCMQSASAETVKCFSEARAAHVTRDRAIQLCQSRRFQ